MTEIQKDDLRSARVASEGARKAEKEGAWKLATSLWTSAADRYAAAGMGQPAEVCRQYKMDAGKRA